MHRATFAAFAVLFVGLASAEEGVRWTTDYRQAAEQAAREHKLILLHFESDACPPCRKLEANVFPRRDVADAIDAGYVAVKVNVDRSPEMARRYSVPRWPMDVIVTPMNQELYRQISPQDPNEYIARLKETSARAGNIAKAPPASTTRTVGFQSSKKSGSDLPADFEGLEIENGAPTTTPQETAPQQSAPPQQPVQAQPAQPQVNEYVTKAQTSPYASQPSPAANRAAAPAAADEGSLYEGIEPVSPRSVPNRGSSNPPSAAPPQAQENTTITTAPAKENSATPAPASAASKAPILPPLGMDGYCVVALHDYNQKVAEAQEAGAKPDPSWQGWVKGNKKFGAIHRGRLYLFASPDAQKTFLADPDRYAPALSGYDPVVFNETQKLVDGKRSIGLCYNGQVFCFANEASLQKFMASPKPFAETVYQAMLRSDKSSKTR